MLNSPSDLFVSLMYHNVCDVPANGNAWPGYEQLSPSVTGYFVDRCTFARHCEIIAQSGSAMQIEELRWTSHTSRPDNLGDHSSSHGPRVLITFDDGWRGTIEHGGPVLAAHGLQAMLFVTTDLIGHPLFVDRELLGRLPEPFVVGSHAKTHRLLANLSNDQIRAELRDSKAVLEDILGREVDAIAYPGGSFDRRVLRLTQETGYRWIFTSEPTVNRLASGQPLLGRLAVKQGTSVETLERWLRGDLRRERLRTWGLAGTKRLLGQRAYQQLRGRLIAEAATQWEMTDLSAASGRTERVLTTSSSNRIPVDV